MTSRKILVHITNLCAWMCILVACSKENESLKGDLTQATIQQELEIIRGLLNQNEMSDVIESLEDLQDVYPQNKDVAELLAIAHRKSALNLPRPM